MEEVKLGNLITLIKGKKPVHLTHEKQEGFLPYVDIEAFEIGKIGCYTDGNKCTPCKDGNLLIVCDGSRSGLVGKALNGYVGSTLAKVVHDEELNTEYLYYFLTSLYSLLNTRKKGTGTPHLNQAILFNQTIRVPNLPEQERIVAKIEELFSQLDEGITNLAKTKKLLRIHKQAVLDKCFSGYAEKHKLKELCAFITKGTTPPKDTFIKTDGIPFIKVYNLTFNTELDFTIEPTFITAATHNNDLSRSIVYPGDVLMNIVGPPLGKVSIVPNEYKEWNINQAIARFRCRDGLYNKYLAYYLLSHRTIEALKEKSKATAGQVNLTLEICRELEIPLIPLDEQRKMVCDIETKLSNIIQIEKTVDATLIQAEALRQSILKKAFNGEMTH